MSVFVNRGIMSGIIFLFSIIMLHT